MQPQDTGSFDWWHALTGGGGGLIGAVAALIWRAARAEPQIRADFRTAIDESERRIEAKIEEAKRHGEQKVEEEVGHFHETFAGIRRQIDDLARDMLPRKEFNQARQEILANAETARKENREDFADIRDRLDSLISGGRK